MSTPEDEYNYWQNLRSDIASKLERLELKLRLASPVTISDEEHNFLIKKTRMFRETLRQIDEKLNELEQ